jgi:hypothetical protein
MVLTIKSNKGFGKALVMSKKGMNLLISVTK